MKIPGKEVHKALAKLKEDRLIAAETRTERSPTYEGGSNKQFTKSFYYIDYKQMIDIVKYRVFKMRKSYESQMKKDGQVQAYFCGACERIYSILEVQSMRDKETWLFRCERCTTELVEYTDDRLKDGPQLVHKRFMDQCSGLISLLKKSENVSVPHFDVSAWIDQNRNSPSLDITAQEADNSSGFESANSSSASVQVQEPAAEAEIDFHQDHGNEQVQKQKSANSLPVWHTHSTVTGEVIIAERKSHLAKEAVDASAGAEYENFIRNSATCLLQSSSQNEALVAKSDATVMVAGVPKPVSEITEEDKEQMTAEEYDVYYKCAMAEPSSQVL